MGQENDYPMAYDAEGVMRHTEKRLRREERRPSVRKASDLLGPGLGPRAVPVTDLDSDTAAFNGIFYAPAGTLNSPNLAKDWVGQTIGDALNGGRQTFSTFRAADSPHETWSRSFTFVPGTTVRVYSPWTMSGDPRALPTYIANSSTEQAALVTAFPPTATRPLVVNRTDLKRIQQTFNGIDWITTYPTSRKRRVPSTFTGAIPNTQTNLVPTQTIPARPMGPVDYTITLHAKFRCDVFAGTAIILRTMLNGAIYEETAIAAASGGQTLAALITSVINIAGTSTTSNTVGATMLTFNSPQANFAAGSGSLDINVEPNYPL